MDHRYTYKLFTHTTFNQSIRVFFQYSFLFAKSHELALDPPIKNNNHHRHHKRRKVDVIIITVVFIENNNILNTVTTYTYT